MKKRNKPMPLDYEITEQPITALGGLPVLISAANALGLDELFDENLDVKLRNRGYSESELAMAIILTLLAGGESLDDVDKIRMDEVVSGRDFPHSTTVGDFLRRFENEELFDALDRVQEVLNRSILEQINYSSLTLDIDATMIKAEGKKRQGTGRSYNGITGYQALAVFASEPGLLLAHDFRPANAHPGSGATELLRQAESMIPEETKLHMRSDSACYNKDVVIFCEDFEMTFTISADLTSPLLSLIESLPDEVWHTLNKSEEVAQAYYQPVDWPKEYRFIIVRKFKDEDLFGKVYKYHALVTNINRGNPALILKRHRRHANVENGIKELKSGFSLAVMPCLAYQANRAWFYLGSIAHNLFIALKVLFLPAKWAAHTIKTVRYRLIHIGCVLVLHSRRRVLKISRFHPWCKDLIKLQKRVLAYI